MLASVYIRNGNIHFYNEKDSLSATGGIAYELGRPLLDFVCYERERFDKGFSAIAEAFDHEYAYMGAAEPEFIAGLKETMSDLQRSEVYIYLYGQTLIEFIYSFIESPRRAIQELEDKIPGAGAKLSWALDFEWPVPPEGKVFADAGRWLYRAALDAIALMSGHLELARKALISEIELLIALRKKADVPVSSPMDYLYMLEVYHQEYAGQYFYLGNPFRAFYGVIQEPEIAELYEINTIADLVRV